MVPASKYLELRDINNIVVKFFWPFDCQNVSMERLSRQREKGSAKEKHEGLLQLISCPNKVKWVDGRKRKEGARRDESISRNERNMQNKTGSSFLICGWRACEDDDCSALQILIVEVPSM